MYFKNKNRIPLHRATSTHLLPAVLAFTFATSSTGAVATPVIADTNDTNWRYQSPPQPGWSDINGSCHTSSATIFGVEASPSGFGDASLAGYIDPVEPSPIAGHTHFASCGTWQPGEGAQAEITDLTVGETYAINFFVAGFRPVAESPERTYEAGNSYQISVGDESSGTVSFNSTSWVAQSYTFTADSTEETISIRAPESSRRSVTHFSIEANAINALDTDQDGLTDTQEVAAGSDVNNTDSDNDGLLDGEEVNLYGTNPTRVDTDGDTLTDGAEVNAHNTDPLKADTDSDGLSDSAELNTYNTDPTKADTDGGGVVDGAEVANGTDPLANNRDDVPLIDSDNDGLSDEAETGLGTDPENPDTDGDNLSDYDEVSTHGTNPTLTDTDNDGLRDDDELNFHITNPLSPDTDEDGLADGVESSTHNTDPALADTDNDTLSDGDEVTIYNTNPASSDTDGDGLTDGQEVLTHATDPLATDTDGSGVNDAEEVTIGTDPLDGTDDLINLDVDKDGIPNAIEGNSDTDADGVPDFEDLDSDNDGIADIIEAGGTDNDNNGKVDNLIDDNSDGLDDTLAITPLVISDQDGDGIADYQDTDSDNDGLSDLFESGGIDADDNGIIDDATDSNSDGWSDLKAANPLPLTDTDNDGSPNYLDLDSDNDGLSDLIESGNEDSNNDGMIDAFLDSDADGIPDTADFDVIGSADSDADGIDDSADASITLGDDINQNGIDDNFEADADGNGRGRTVLSNSSLPDSNNNGITDVFEINADAIGFITGINGGFGCSIFDSKRSKIDPSLLLLTLASLGALVRRRQQPRVNHQSPQNTLRSKSM